MALTKRTSAPKFESEENTIDVDAVVAVEEDTTSFDEPQAVESAPTKPIQAEAAPTATQVIAKAATTSAVTLGKKFSGAMKELEEVFPIEAVRQIGLAAPRLTIDTGGFSKDGKDLGKTLIVQVISYNKRWLVSPGVSGDEGKELVRYSYDNVTLEGDTQSPRDYLASLKNDGYSKASIKEYMDLWCIVTGPDTDDTEPVLNETVLIQLSPQSAGQFQFWQLSQGVKIAKGLASETECLKIQVERIKSGSDTYGRASFSAA